MARSVAVLAMVSSLVLLGGGAAAVARGDPLRGAPPVGSCYDVSGRTASLTASLSAEPISCRNRHTLWVAAVTVMPERYVAAQHDGSPLHGPAVGYFDRVCLPAIGNALGGLGTTFARSAYMYFWFVASASQQAAGGHWLSCAIGIAKARDLVVTRQVAPTKVDTGLPNPLQLCGTVTYAATTCAAPHAYRESFAFAVPHRLTRTTVQAVASRTCPAHVASPAWMYWWRIVTPTHNLITCLTQTRH